MDQTIEGDIIQTQRKGVFNVSITPARCLWNHRPVLLGSIYRGMHIVRWRSTNKTDANLTSSYAGLPPITEKADQDLRDGYYTPLFIPKRVSFVSKIPRNLAQLLSEFVGGYISFRWEGVTYKGFPLKVSEVPATNKEQTTEVLLHPYTDIE